MRARQPRQAVEMHPWRLVTLNLPTVAAQRYLQVTVQIRVVRSRSRLDLAPPLEEASFRLHQERVMMEALALRVCKQPMRLEVALDHRAETSISPRAALLLPTLEMYRLLVELQRLHLEEILPSQ